MSNPFFSLLVSVLSGSTRRKVKYWRIDAIVSYMFPIIDVENIVIGTTLNEVIISNIVVEKFLETDTAQIAIAFNNLEIKTPLVVVGDSNIIGVNYYLDKDQVTSYTILNSVVINKPNKSPEWDEVENAIVSIAFNSVDITLPVRTGNLDSDTATVAIAFNSVVIT